MPLISETTPLLSHLVTGGSLDAQQSEALFEKLLSGGLDEAQIGALLALIQSRGPTAAELTGAARAMRAHVTRVPYAPKDGVTMIDTCGTGGAPKTFNVSTAAAIVAAAAMPETGSGVERVAVAKHGNRSRTGRGSAEVLAKLGVNIDATPEQQAACLEEAGLCFCFAIRHHPAMKHASGPRASLGFPTIFNLLGPLTNPAGADRQLIGVYRPEFVPLVGAVLANLGAVKAIVVHARDGLDEISIGATTDCAIVDQGEVSIVSIDPEELGLAGATPSELEARDADHASELIGQVLDGVKGPHRDMVLVNAGSALVVAGAAGSIASGIILAAEAIDSGRARETLDTLARISSL